MPEAQHEEWPVPISTTNTETGATLTWRRKGRLYLTAIVKATLKLVPGGTMTLCQPEPVAREEQDHAAGLRSAGDLAPFRRRADVVVTGHAVLPSGPPGAGLPVRFWVSREGGTVLDKSLSIQVPTWTTGGLVRLFGLGPLSRRWPVRKRLLEGLDAEVFEGTSLDLPPAFDETYFQVAPVDQQIDVLHGDEHFAFDGARGDGSRIESRLPGMRAMARIHGQGDPSRALPLSLVMDLLHVDLDQWVCNVTWRGGVRVPQEEDLAAMRVIAAVELLPPARAAEHAAPPSARLDKNMLPLPKPPPKREVSWAPAPAAGGAPKQVEKVRHPFEGTFRHGSAAPEPLPPSSRRAPPSVEAPEVTRTMVLPGGVLAPIEEGPSSPPRAAAPPPASDRIDTTMRGFDAISPPGRILQPALPPPNPPPKPAHPYVAAQAMDEHPLEELDSEHLELDSEHLELDSEHLEPVELEAPMDVTRTAMVEGLLAPATPFAPVAPPMVALPPMVAPLAPEPHAGPQHDVSPWATGVPSRSAPSPILPAPVEPIRPAMPEPVAPMVTSEAPITQRAPAQVGQDPPKRTEASLPGASPPGAMTFGAHFLAAMELFEATSQGS